MSSINTNYSALVALDSLKATNKNLANVQQQISTGREVNSARDNAALWSISTVIESDIEGFDRLSSSLNLGSSATGVARQASENIVKELQDIRTGVIEANEDSLDGTKIQADIDAAIENIGNFVNAASFNGTNLLDGSSTDALNVLASINRAADGSITTSSIGVDRVNLTTAENREAITAGADGFATVAATGLDNSVADTVEDVTAITVATVADADTYTYSFDIAGQTISLDGTDFGSGDNQDAVATAIAGAITAAGITGVTATANANVVELDIDGGVDATISNLAITSDGTTDVTATAAALGAAGDQSALDNSALPADATDVNAVTIAAVAAGDATNSVYELEFGDTTVSYTATATDTQDNIAAGLVAAINAANIDGVTAKVDGTNANEIDFDITGGTDAAFTLTQNQVEEGKTVGGLFDLGSIDVTTSEGATAALTTIDNLLNTAIDAAASFGTAQSQIDKQVEFIGNLSDSLEVGVSTLVDANLEEASARLQALQVQQQLGVQALSIANQGPQALLSLFR